MDELWTGIKLDSYLFTATPVWIRSMGDVTFKAEVTQTLVIGTIPRQLVFNVLQQFEHYSYSIVKLLHSDIESGHSECIIPLLLKRSQFLLSNSDHYDLHVLIGNHRWRIRIVA